MAGAGDEFELIDRIRRQAGASPAVPVGIGDDAALLSVGAGHAPLLVTTDVLMEGVHFDLSQTTPEAAGRKALAVNLSDVAAMAGRPTAAFLGLVLPRAGGEAFAESVMQGVYALAAQFDVAVAGGDTNVWDGPAVISVTLVGEPTGRGAVLRSGAEPGDWLMVTGRLGGSLTSGRHLSFTPRVHEAQKLLAGVDVHAMIDLSDGLASDLRHILDESGVGASVSGAAIPIHDDVDADLPAGERRRRALSDGEDFELLFAVPADHGRRLLAEPPFETPITRVGKITDGPDCWLVDEVGNRTRLAPSGWEHRF